MLRRKGIEKAARDGGARSHERLGGDRRIRRVRVAGVQARAPAAHLEPAGRARQPRGGILSELDFLRLYERVCRFTGHDPALDPPVEARMVGMLSDRDLLPVIGRAQGEFRRVEDVMTKDYVGVVPGTRLSTVAECMLKNGFHALPVLVNGALRGIITSADVLAVLCRCPSCRYRLPHRGRRSADPCRPRGPVPRTRGRSTGHGVHTDTPRGPASIGCWARTLL